MSKGITVGMDMGDKNHSVCVLDADGEVLARATVTNTGKAIRKYFGELEPCRVALEAGTHSGWVSRLLEGLGHKVLVGNPRKLRVIWDSDEKDDDRDAEMLARIARFDPHLLYPIHHRSQQAQSDLAVIKARDMLVKSRTILIAHARGAVKSTGQRISKCSAEAFHIRLLEEMPAELMPALEPIMKSIADLTCRIRHYDKVLDKLCTEKYPETEGLRAISGVGPVTTLAFILTIDESSRFDKSRAIGPFLGLTPKRDQSGQTDKQLRITKAGDAYLRRLLVGCAQYILGPFGPDCDLRRFGMKLAARGGKNAKRRAVIAVARKLAVMMHHLWKSGAAYDPFYQQNRKKKAA
ncbi:MAG: IS110 family transposase [Kiritimatiellae bacterium]|nr:IS110 family transposase [Kiritimatiellia bacterium]